MFQLNLSREVDADADVALTEFDKWYKQNNISALLRARKSAREQRDNQQRRGQISPNFGGGHRSSFTSKCSWWSPQSQESRQRGKCLQFYLVLTLILEALTDLI